MCQKLVTRIISVIIVLHERLPILQAKTLGSKEKREEILMEGRGEGTGAI